MIGAGTTIGPNATIGPHVRLGRRCKIGASAVVDGWTEIGDDTEVFPFASIGLLPQDLKYAGEPTRLVIGQKNVFREFVTVHRGTVGGGGLTTIGDRNVFMAYAHVAHDCHVGDDTIFGNARDARRPRHGAETARRSAPSPACTSSAASAATPSSAASRWSPRTRCRSPRRSATGRPATTA